METPRIVDCPPKKLIGMRINCSLVDDKTIDLWKKFKPRVREIESNLKSGYYSVEIFPSNLSPETFTPDTQFTKWAAVEVNGFENLPDGMETYLLSGGTYAVFVHEGPASAFDITLQYIFETWLPNSPYELDNREHFEIMGDDYKHPEASDNREEVWIPLKKPSM